MTRFRVRSVIHKMWRELKISRDLQLIWRRWRWMRICWRLIGEDYQHLVVMKSRREGVKSWRKERAEVDAPRQKPPRPGGGPQRRTGRARRKPPPRGGIRRPTVAISRCTWCLVSRRYYFLICVFGFPIFIILFSFIFILGLAYLRPFLGLE